MRVRPATPDDAEAIHAVVLARDLADIGRPDYTLADVRQDLAAAAIDCFVAEDGGAIVGFGLIDFRGSMVAVHPGAEGRGAGTSLREALERRARERGEKVAQMVTPANAGAVAHLRAAGYVREHVYTRMRARLGHLPAAPAGAEQFDLAAEGPAVHALIEQAFAEIDGNHPESYESFRVRVASRCEPAFRLGLRDGEGIAAAAVGERWEDGVGYVGQLAVAPRARGRGHGRALLLALLDAFRAAGLTNAELSVHGTNAPATGLYTSVGMRPDFSQERWAPAQSSSRVVLEQAVLERKNG